MLFLSVITVICKIKNTRSRNRPLYLWALLLSVIAHLGIAYSLAKEESAGRSGGTYRPGGPTTNIVYFPAFNTEMVSQSITSDTSDSKNMAGLIDPSKSEKIGNSEAAEVSITSPFSIDETEVQKSPALQALPSEPYYFLIKELTQTPGVVFDAATQLTLTATHLPAGTAILHILISEYGDVDRVIMEDSVLSEADQSMLVAAFLKTKFQPGEINGVPVKSELKIELMLAD